MADPASIAERPVAWRPQRGPQKALIDCPVPEILFGGARGGGKTDGFLGKWAIKSQKYRRGFNAVFFRQAMPQQDDLIDRAREIYEPIGAKWQEHKKMFLMPGGGRVRFRPLETVADADKYQGRNISDAAVEEAGNYPASAPIDRLFGCLRSSSGVPVQLMLSANPGGPGHHWIKQRYIDPAPGGLQILTRALPNGRTHRAVYIPSRVQDNKILLSQDPSYVDRLYLVGSENLVKAWLEGDWSVIEGAYFPEFSMTKHVIAPFEIPEHWARIRAMDWGSARPFCVLWMAVSDGDNTDIPRGALVVYREWYGWNGEPNVGCKMTAVDVGAGIAKLEAGETLMDEVIDPAAFSQDGGPSIVERMNLNFRRADNARIARVGAMGGWDQVRERLVGEEGKPMLYLFSTITHLIRTLPALQHDSHRPEDVDTESEDHACFIGDTIVNGKPIKQVGFLTRSDASLVRLTLQDGRQITCTPDHLFLTGSGEWVPARSLQNRSLCSDPRSSGFLGLTITSAVFTISARALDCTAWCGNIIAGLWRMASTFITGMRIAAITTLRIWKRCLLSIISAFTPIQTQNSHCELGLPRLNGMGAAPAGSGMRSIGSSPLGRLFQRALRWCASSAGSLMRRAAAVQLVRASAIRTAKCVRVLAVSPLRETQPVYCLASRKGWLSVEGIIASNCDALRYGCMSRPLVRDKPGIPKTRFETELTIDEIIKRASRKRLAEG